MLKRFENLAIVQRLNIVVISITLVTLIVVVYLTLFSTAEALGNNAENRAIETNASLSLAIQNNINHVTDVLDAIVSEADIDADETLTGDSFNTAVTKIMGQETNILLRRIVIYIPDQSVTIYNFPDPSTGSTSLKSSLPPSRLGEDHWIFEFGGTRGWYGPIAPAYLQLTEDTVSTAVTYPARGNEIEAILWADISVSTLNSLLRSTLAMNPQEIDGDFYFLMNNAGDIITSINTRTVEPATFNRVIDSGMELESRTFAESMVDDIVVFKSTVEPANWGLISAIPSSVFSVLPPETTAQVIIVSILGVLFTVWATNQVVKRTLVRPLNMLGTAAMEMGSGDLRRVIEFQDHYDEIGQLARTLEDMRNSLKYSYDTLEQRIDRRTAELDLARAKAQSTAQELRAVYDESLSVVSDYQLENILDTFTRRIVTLMNSDYCSVWLVRSNGRELRRVAQVGGDSGSANIIDTEDSPIIDLNQGMVGLTVRKAAPVIVDQYSTWEHRLQPPVTTNIERVLCVPLLSSGNTLGAVMTARSGDGLPFSESEQRLLTLFANMVSPSVRNAQLFVQLEAARAEADRANDVKTRFLASVTHELRTPLNLIINNMDFMRVGTFGSVTEEQENRLDQTIRSAEHLLYLINDLLDVSKIDAGEMQLFIQPTEIQPIIEDALDSALMLLEKEKKLQDIVLNVDMEENLPLIPMDARRVRQVLTNLLSNAVKFTKRGEIHLDVRRNNGHVLVKVRDTGMGIPDDEKGKLFQQFERTNTAKRLGIEGTGLGLQISKHLVEQHGGEIWFDSQQGIGTTFSFTLPIDETATGTQNGARSTRTQLMQVYLDEDFSEAETEEITIDREYE